MKTSHAHAIKRSYAPRQRHLGWQVGLCLALLTGAASADNNSSKTAFNFTEVVNQNDAAFTQLLGINNNGQIAGYFGDGSMVPNHGFTLNQLSKFIDENFPGSTQTQVIAINNLDQTAGFYVTAEVTHGFSFNNKEFNTIDAPGTNFNQILGLNDLGQMAGYSSTDPTGATLQKAFVYEADGSFNYLHLPAMVHNVPIGNTQATGINNAQVVCGFMVDQHDNNYGFVWDKKTNVFRRLQYPNANFTQALGINNAGQVVGVYSKDGGKDTHGFVYKQGKYVRVDEPKSKNHKATLINGINDRGQIVGFYTNNAGSTVGFYGNPSVSLW
jgi:probable HAF family extracellular repeat protein